MKISPLLLIAITVLLPLPLTAADKKEPKKPTITKKVTPKKTTTKKVTPKKDAPKKTTTKKVTPKKDAPKKTTPKKVTPKKDAPKKTTPKKDTPKKDTPKKDTPKKDTPKKTTTKKPASHLSPASPEFQKKAATWVKALPSAKKTKLLTLLNKGVLEDFKPFPGVGAVKFANMKKGRPFKQIEDLANINGFGETTFKAVINQAKQLK